MNRIPQVRLRDNILARILLYGSRMSLTSGLFFEQKLFQLNLFRILQCIINYLFKAF